MVRLNSDGYIWFMFKLKIGSLYEDKVIIE